LKTKNGKGEESNMRERKEAIRKKVTFVAASIEY
jgi:hypothetical protein